MISARISQSFDQAANSYMQIAYGKNENDSLQAQCANYLAHLISKREFENLLDLGCGPGAQTGYLSPLARNYIGLDVAPRMVEQGRKAHPDLIWLQADMHKIPLPDESLDLVYANLSMQWHTNKLQLLNELARVLRPGGEVVFSTILSGSLPELHALWKKGVIRGVNQYPNLLSWQMDSQNSGFQIMKQAQYQVTTEHCDPKSLLTSLKGIGASTLQQRLTAQFGLRGKAWLRDLYEHVKAVCQTEKGNELALHYEVGVFHLVKSGLTKDDKK